MALLAGVESGSVDALICDPPYAMTQLSWDAEIDWPDFWQLAQRACKPEAVMAVFSAQPFTSKLILSNEDFWRYEIIWQKTMGTRFFDAAHRPLQGHENIEVFTSHMKAATYNPQKWQGKPYRQEADFAPGHYGTTSDCPPRESSDGKRHPLTVLRFSNADNHNKEHPSQKPLGLMRWLVRAYTDPGNLVLDPFCGSGSTGVAALMEGRRFLGMEKKQEYVQVTKSRTGAVLNAPTLFPPESLSESAEND